jgi:hypothetical protein
VVLERYAGLVLGRQLARRAVPRKFDAWEGPSRFCSLMHVCFFVESQESSNPLTANAIEANIPSRVAENLAWRHAGSDPHDDKVNHPPEA